MHSILIKSIQQVDDYSFSILWSDEKQGIYRLSELQKQCPCAGCLDEVTGKRLLPVDSVKPDVSAVRIVNVGRYALRIQFTSGCSFGIYGFDFLYNLCKEVS